MYCRTCGTENPDYANYCSNDGTSLHIVQTNASSVIKRMDFCPKCGAKTTVGASYCSDCGSDVRVMTFDKRQTKQKAKAPLITPKKEITKDLQSLPLNFKKWLSKQETTSLFAGFGFFIGLWMVGFLIFFFIIKDKVNKILDENILFSEIMNDFDVKLGFFKLFSLHNASEFKLVNTERDEFGTISMTISQGNILFLLFLFIGLLIGSWITYRSLRNESKNICTFLKLAISFGGLYGLIVFIFALIGKGEFILVGDYDSVILSFSAFPSFIRGFIYATLLSFISFLIVDKVYDSHHSLRTHPIYDAIVRGVGTYFIGFIIVALLLTSMGYFNIAKPLKEEEVRLPITEVANVSAKMYSLYHFGGLDVFVDGSVWTYDDRLNLEFGLFSSETKSKKEALDELNDIVTEINPSLLTFNWNWLYAFMLVPASLLFISGRKYYARFQDNIYIHLLYLSAAYAVMMFFINYFIKFHLLFKGVDFFDMEMRISTPLFLTLMMSFIFAYVFSLLGSYSHKFLKGGN